MNLMCICFYNIAVHEEHNHSVNKPLTPKQRVCAQDCNSFFFFLKIHLSRVATRKKQACFFSEKTFFFFAKKTQPEKNTPKFCFFHF